MIWIKLFINYLYGFEIALINFHFFLKYYDAFLETVNMFKTKLKLTFYNKYEVKIGLV